VWDKAVPRDRCCGLPRSGEENPSRDIAALKRAREARRLPHRRQLSLGLRRPWLLHTKTPAEAARLDVVAATNAVLARVTIPPAPDTTFVTYFGHLAGYDAGYYGYLWSKVMAIDMASEFKKAPGGFLDEGVGRRLRDEVYGAGDTRDVGVSVEKFLGRPSSMRPFLNMSA